MYCLRKAIKEIELQIQLGDRGHMVEGFPMSDAYRECSMQRMGSLIDQDGEDKIMQMGEFC